MAKKSKQETPPTMKNVEQTLTTTEQFLENHYKELITALAVVVGIIGIVWIGRIYLEKRNTEAQSQIFQAERYLEMDSLNLALYGDGNYLGFIDIASDYKFTRSGNLAKYGAGICFLHLGQYEEAIEYLEDYSTKDKVMGSLAIGAIGDAYVEMGDTEAGADKYLEAADLAGNSFNSPLYLMKAGELYELEGNYNEALRLYEMISDKYPASTEGNSIDKYIARVKLLMN
ncbi:MAG TPA: tetratricopeptide repeat protein [Bacteroidales bacterium]|nr:tetratricopeptide repeat protein [Bacteroidales bacterium]HPF02269.1 tetratricopeptide repeat protein [Bacteroidales bacterium]HPJ60530.1 tetratricopeptide repeat protein [Bacteroidales bacterium]HPR12111.1 tetratricopeptide repeat protein [Bacteroidales bacterium]HRW85311.1 tetratricopeptide repeat protein [Bacteroidales bacterium]